MSSTDEELVRRWMERQDAEAFMEIASRYSGMVYATCKRILGNATEAEDVAQECFEILAQKGGKAGRYLGAWLHKVATNRALKHIRAEKRRKDRETRFVTERESTSEVQWNDIYAYVDEAVAELPEKLRVPIVLHFFENRTHDAIAETIGTSRTTVTYRIRKGVEEIRRSLKRRGVIAPTVVLTSLLAKHLAAEAAPATVTVTLGKLALAGTSAAASGAAGTSATGIAALGGALVAKKIILATILISCAVVGIVVMQQPERKVSTAGELTEPSAGSGAALRGAPLVPPAVPPEESISGTVIVEEADESTPGATVSGRVVDTDALSVPNARVMLLPEADNRKDKMDIPTAAGGADTDEGGAFEITEVSPGTYSFFVLVRTVTGSQALWAINDPLTVAAGEKLTGVEVVIRGKEEGVIEGHARDPAGIGIRGVTAICRIREEHIAGRTTTETSGQYRFERLNEGTVNITFQHDEYEFAFLEDVPVGTTDADVVMVRKGSVSGTVMDAGTREPIEDFSIAVALEHASIPFRHHVPYGEPQRYHSESGKFLVKIDAAGTVALKASAPGYAPQEVTDIDIEGGQEITGVMFYLPRGNVIRGTVIAAADSRPVEGARIYFDDAPIGAQPRDVAAVTGADGGFVILDVAAGEQVIGAKHPHFMPASVVAMVREGRETEVTIPLEVAGMIAGYVSENGLPSSGARINLAGTDGYQRGSAPTDENGYYEFTSLAPGRYELEAYPSSFDEPGGLKAVEQAIVEVQQGYVTEKDFGFVGGNAAIEGYVMRNGVRVYHEDARVFAATASEPGQSAGESSLDESGFYRIEGLPGGYYVVTAFVPGDATDRGALGRVDVQVGDGRTVRADIDIGGSCAIKGRVSLPAGYDMAVVFVRDGSALEPLSLDDTAPLAIAGQVLGMAQCAPDGTYEISDLAPGSYNVTAVCAMQAEGVAPTVTVQDSRVITLKVGQTLQVDFRF